MGLIIKGTIPKGTSISSHEPERFHHLVYPAKQFPPCWSRSCYIHIWQRSSCFGFPFFQRSCFGKKTQFTVTHFFFEMQLFLFFGDQSYFLPFFGPWNLKWGNKNMLTRWTEFWKEISERTKVWMVSHKAVDMNPNAMIGSIFSWKSNQKCCYHEIWVI